LRELPSHVDPCGERGEFHTWVYAGPLLDEPLALHTGEQVLRDERFQYCDLLDLSANAPTSDAAA
jgi:diphthamide synthase (EF-2-diphthine--ammonia ligase)